MLLMLENQVVTTGSKDKNSRSLSYQARAAASRCLTLRTAETYKISKNILESNYFAKKLSNNLINI